MTKLQKLTGTTEHTAAVEDLMRRFEARGVKVRAHRYHPEAFGSFELVVGKGQRLLKFTWDGKDRFLEVRRSAVAGDDPVAWIQTKGVAVPDGGGLFQNIGQVIEEQFAI